MHNHDFPLCLGLDGRRHLRLHKHNIPFCFGLGGGHHLGACRVQREAPGDGNQQRGRAAAHALELHHVLEVEEGRLDVAIVRDHAEGECERDANQGVLRAVRGGVCRKVRMNICHKQQ